MEDLNQLFSIPTIIHAIISGSNKPVTIPDPKHNKKSPTICIILFRFKIN